MKFTVNPKIFERFPGVEIGYGYRKKESFKIIV